ncbi:MAG: sensor histidine kinase [Rhodothalassiaceae bacterium]
MSTGATRHNKRPWLYRTLLMTAALATGWLILPLAAGDQAELASRPEPSRVEQQPPAPVAWLTLSLGLVLLGLTGASAGWAFWRLSQERARRVQAERHVMLARREAEQANAAKSQFLARVCHELRTPLNAILGFSEIVKDEMFGPVENSKYRAYVVDIHTSGLHLLGLINDILDIAQLEQDQVEVTKAVFSLKAVVDWAKELVHADLKRAGVALVTDIDTDVEQLEGSEASLRQILLNLLSNAIKFTPEGGRITIRAGQNAEGRVVLEVSDTGIGIPAEHLRTLIQPFTQLESAFAPRRGGMGIGLSIVHGLCVKIGAQLEIDSQVGKGTCVRVVLNTASAACLAA